MVIWADDEANSIWFLLVFLMETPGIWILEHTVLLRGPAVEQLQFGELHIKAEMDQLDDVLWTKAQDRRAAWQPCRMGSKVALAVLSRGLASGRESQSTLCGP